MKIRIKQSLYDLFPNIQNETQIFLLDLLFSNNSLMPNYSGKKRFKILNKISFRIITKLLPNYSRIIETLHELPEYVDHEKYEDGDNKICYYFFLLNLLYFINVYFYILKNL